MEEQLNRHVVSQSREPADVAEDILPLRFKEPLEEQCVDCFHAFKSCVGEARRLANLDQAGQLTKPRLRTLARQLDEQRLRLDVWMLDCGVATGGLPKASQDPDLTATLTTLFRPLHTNLRSIFQEVKIMAEEESTGTNIQQADVRIASAINSITFVLGELARLGSRIQMTHAIRSKVGPYAKVRQGVEKIVLENKRNLQEQQEVGEGSESTVSSEERSNGEECPNCRQIFPWQIFSFHEENCKMAKPVPQSNTSKSNVGSKPLPSLYPVHVHQRETSVARTTEYLEIAEPETPWKRKNVLALGEEASDNRPFCALCTFC